MQKDSMETDVENDIGDLPLIGRKIVVVRDMTPEELQAEGWSEFRRMCPKVLVLDNGITLFASCDPEGNSPGMIFGQSPNGHGFRVI